VHLDRLAQTLRMRIWKEDEFRAETVINDNGFDQETASVSIIVPTRKKHEAIGNVSAIRVRM